MKIVHAAGEMFPYAKTGGLADVVGALAGALTDRGHEVSVFVPGYRMILEHPDARAAELRLRLKIEMAGQFYSGEVRVFSPRANLRIYLICRDEYFDRRQLYGTGGRDYEDNAERFIFFSQAVVETIRLLEIGADIVHGHDWQAALIPLLLREAERRYGTTLAVKTLFTVHNIAYQGLFPARTFALTNLPEELNSIDGLEYYSQVNFLKGGILFADRITTVSPTYAREIQTPEFGCGLDGVVQTRVDDIVGLLNGVDTAVWNPSIDPVLPARYSTGNMGGKQACRGALLQLAGLKAGLAVPVFGMVCRLVEQKGIDLLLANREFFLRHDCRLIVLGTGDRRLEEALRAFQIQSPANVYFESKVDERMSHLVEAGSDFFVMPSLFEPCGLNQMYSQIYGTIPIASRVGGLVDTVTDADDDPRAGTGLTCAPNAESLAGALGRALVLFADKPRMAAVAARGMARDFSWQGAALAYERLYQDSL